MRSPDHRGAQVPDERIYINGRFLTQRVTGVQRYARETLLALDGLLSETAETTTWTLLVPPGTVTVPLARIATVEIGRWKGHLWEQIDLAWHARDGLLLNFGFTGPLVKANQIITIHDAAVMRIPQAYGWRFRLFYRLVMRILIPRVRRIFTVSRFSADESVACFGVARARLRLMTEGWQHLERVVADEGVIERHALAGRPFVLAVSSPTPNKNFGIIASALALMGKDAPLCIVVGAADAAIFKSEARADALLRVGYVTDGELKALYQHASCFVFPSFYEGFGIPALEAMASGCPVLASTAPAVRETCGEAARYFDPFEPAELARRLHDLFGAASEAELMRQQGRERAALFSWRSAARLNLEAITEAARGGD